MSERDEIRQRFLAENGWGDASVDALPADASFRRYFRLTRDGESRLLMDAPPDKEDSGPYVTVARHLCRLGLSAPQIYAVDGTNGLVLIEDFGDDTYTRLLRNGASEEALYTLAVDALIDLHRHAEAADVGVPPYDRSRLLEEAGLLPDWYVPALGTDMDVPPFRTTYLSAWNTVLDAAPVMEPTLVLRDYHVDNLMLLEGRQGAAACGLLDFQDGVIGAPAYDVVSLLEDARRDVPDDLTAAMLARYCDAFPEMDSAAFDTWYAILGAQRHCKVAGIFVRLWARDGKDVYLGHIPRVMRLLERSLKHPALEPVRDTVASVLAADAPTYDDDTRRRVRRHMGLEDRA